MKTVLFVCTGNTCRSPMAEAIARRLLGARDGVGVRVLSAGVNAREGASYSPEVESALASIGVPSRGGTARLLTRALVESADRIYTMTGAHARVVRAMDPSSAHKVQVLDPEGRDVPDPIGGPLRVYEAAARAIERMIEQRVADWEQA